MSTQTVTIEELVDELTRDLPEQVHLEIHGTTVYLWREVRVPRCCNMRPEATAFTALDALGVIRGDGAVFEQFNCCTSEIVSGKVHRFDAHDEDAPTALREALDILLSDLAEEEAEEAGEGAQFVADAAALGITVEAWAEEGMAYWVGSCTRCDDVYPANEGGCFDRDEADDVLAWARAHKRDCTA
ncbi:hypothetical protein GXB85_13440 [Cellulomonas sp. APG4]|uniref:hypothetical protein n=1 Tax=Cellulomonas sp. APG4 TaxID=1538656 RepID=UPI00137A15AD|nr:hypothetical protein [Cellulomonas sp. APG4]NCT91946.1 hypothetical protein [Cellulomonas sp. APG4]